MIKIKTFFVWLLAIALFIVSLYGIVWYTFTQQYVQDGPKSATMGIFFQKTLNLEEYKRVSNGNGWLGKYDRYSRSDRHNDVITIYCRSYCSK